ncbi:hypothetical protein PMH09_22410, partial [Roseofilum sp. BLCC_M143]
MSNILPPAESILAELAIDPTQIKSIRPRSKRSQYRAIINWLANYKVQKEMKNLEMVKGLLESFYHFCEIKYWQEASIIL